MVKIGADPTFKTPVGAEMGQKRRRDLAAAGGEDVRGPAPVCPCCRGVCASRAVGAAAAGAEGRKACGLQSDKHFLLGWLQPHRLCRKHRVQVACSFSSRPLAKTAIFASSL